VKERRSLSYQLASYLSSDVEWQDVPCRSALAGEGGTLTAGATAGLMRSITLSSLE
jgi:hypothetical protein